MLRTGEESTGPSMPPHPATASATATSRLILRAIREWYAGPSRGATGQRMVHESTRRTFVSGTHQFAERPLEGIELLDGIEIVGRDTEQRARALAIEIEQRVAARLGGRVDAARAQGQHHVRPIPSGALERCDRGEVRAVVERANAGDAGAAPPVLPGERVRAHGGPLHGRVQ